MSSSKLVCNGWKKNRLGFSFRQNSITRLEWLVNCLRRSDYRLKDQRVIRNRMVDKSTLKSVIYCICPTESSVAICHLRPSLCFKYRAQIGRKPTGDFAREMDKDYNRIGLRKNWIYLESKKYVLCFSFLLVFELFLLMILKFRLYTLAIKL